MIKKFTLVACLLFVTAVPALAQTYGLPGSQMSDPVGYYINQSFWSNKAFTTAMANELYRSGRRKGSRPAPTAKTPMSVTAFRSSGYVLPEMLAAAGQNPREKTETKQLITQLLDLYHQTAKKDGFQSNDLAYAFEYFVVNNYNVQNYFLDIHADPRIQQMSDSLARLQAVYSKQAQAITLTQERAVYEQFKNVLTQNPEMKKMTDRQKQEATELLAVMTGVSVAQFTKGSRSKSAADMEKGSQLAQRNLERLFGNSAANLKFTNNGMEF